MVDKNTTVTHVSHAGRRAAVLALALALWCAAAAQAADTLQTRIDTILADTNLSNGIQGVLVKSLKTGSVLYERNSHLAMIPASNQKLLVSATVLDQLGPDYTLKTELYASGKVNAKGVLEGDIVLKGGGDPTLATADLERFVAQLKSRGIRKVTGGVIVDDTLFDTQRLGWGWSWDNLPYYYSAEISALNLDRNVAQVYVSPGEKDGARAVAWVKPAADYMAIDCTATTDAAGSEKSISVWRKLGTNTITVSGSIPLGSKAESPETAVTVQEPALYTGHVLRTLMARQGMQVIGGVSSGKLPQGAELVYSHASRPISEMVALLNKPSDNLIAEVLLKALGAADTGKGSADSGAEVEKRFFERIGMDLTALKIVDGSGLSRLNYVSPRNLVALLTHMWGHKDSGVFVGSLPIAGVDGTLRNRMKGTAAEKNVKAKTGYIGRVSSLSGYVSTSSGEPLVFSIMMNHHLCANAPATAAQNAICQLLAELP